MEAERMQSVNVLLLSDEFLNRVRDLNENIRLKVTFDGIPS